MSERETIDAKETGRINRQAWLDSPYIGDDTKEEIRAMTDENEVAEAFSRDLAFGTGGMRGIMGPGSDRMNLYTVRRAILGVAGWLLKTSSKDPERGAAIACDTRNNSMAFARHAALTLADEGVKVYLFASPTPTPVLSNAIRHFGCATGVVITASHNTKEFNGMKIYNDGGCQLPPEEATPLMEVIETIPLFSPAPKSDFDALAAEGKIVVVGEDFRRQFVATVLEHSLLEDQAAKATLSVVYTPLNGTGNLFVREALREAGFAQVTVVPEQELPDGEFPTVIQPNPEDTRALAMAIDLALRTKADLVVGTDPDADRLGTAIYHQGEFHTISGNQIGVLLTDYILTIKKNLDLLPEEGVFINTIVSSSLGDVIARAYGLEVVKTLTGFKYIGEQMIKMESEAASGGKRTYVFGYEESNGYLVGDFARDKDAIGAALLFCEAAAYWKRKGMTAIDRLEEIFRIYGYYLDHLDNFVFPGIEGMEKMAGLMDKLRQAGQNALPGVEEVEDYLKGINGIPSDNVLRFILKGDAWIAARPSGTEPKMKFYYSIRGDDKEKAGERLAQLQKAIGSLVE